MGDACVACDVWCVVCDVWCVVYDVCVVCGVLCVSLRAGGVLFKTRTQYRGVLGKKGLVPGLYGVVRRAYTVASFAALFGLYRGVVQLFMLFLFLWSFAPRCLARFADIWWPGI